MVAAGCGTSGASNTIVGSAQPDAATTGPWSVVAATGTFVADLQGSYDGAASPQRMTGGWTLQDMLTGIACTGPFEVARTR